MGTKNHPGKFDCYKNAEPDEPMFILLGRDPSACHLVRLWAKVRMAKGEDPDKVIEALECADAMEAWAQKLGKTERIESVPDILSRVVDEDLDDTILCKICNKRHQRDFCPTFNIEF